MKGLKTDGLRAIATVLLSAGKISINTARDWMKAEDGNGLSVGGEIVLERGVTQSGCAASGCTLEGTHLHYVKIYKNGIALGDVVEPPKE